MENKKPNVVLFTTAMKNRYMYDACTNRVFPAPEPYYEVAQLYSSHDKEEVISRLSTVYGEEKCTEAYNKIDSWVNKENAFFNYDESVSEFSYSPEDLESGMHNNSNPHLILGITEDCNFRCKYCVYGGQYKNFRTHTRKYMPFETAKKTIDYFFTRFADESKAETLAEQNTISFYGGEALLAFPMIKEIIRYVNKNYKGRPLDFRITSNGYLLNDTIMDYLAENNIGFAVSLDGPEEDHDRNRVLAGGEKTFEKVFGNLMRLRKRHPEYYKKKVMLQASYDWKSDLVRITDFFTKNKKILPKGKTFSQINLKDTDYYSRFSEEDKNEFYNTLLRLRKEYLSYLSDPDSEEKTGIDAFFRGSYYKISCRPFHKRSSYTGICTPGSRLYAACDGTFHLCERINDTMPIGNCDTGLDYKKIYKLKNAFYEEVIKKGNCSTCIARQHCSVCFVAVADDGKFSVNGTCDSIRLGFKQDITEYYSLLEKNQSLAKKFLPEASFLELH